MFLARTGVSPVGESLYQSEQVHEEAIDLIADIIENALRFTEKEAGKWQHINTQLFFPARAEARRKRKKQAA